MAVLLACVFWGLDNNLTRGIEALPASSLACVKGWVAGLFNTFLAFFLTKETVSGSQVAGCLVIGAFSYGMSLVLFIEALRLIGSARASSYFASGPFFGMFCAVFFLGEQISWLSSIAATLMGAGVLVLYYEEHAHRHTHEALTHRHRHIHDEHHQHSHDGTEGPEPHDHFHCHEPITHSHAHFPDSYHRHSHGG